MTNEEIKKLLLKAKHEKLSDYCFGKKCACCPLFQCSEISCPWQHGEPFNENDYNELEITKAYEAAYGTELIGVKLQGAKADAGKPRVSLVPMQIVRDIAVIRQYGVDKYKTVDNWKNVEVERYIDALGRHTLEFLNNPLGVDEESGYPHLWHIGCNVAFLSELMKGEWK